jgi:hypothetical protein
MHLILRYANGHRAEALLLTMTAEAMRVVRHRSNDTVEYRNVAGRWVGDDGTRVSIDAMFPATALESIGHRGLTLAAGDSGRG